MGRQAIRQLLLAGVLGLIPVTSPSADHCAPTSVPETIMGLPLIAEHRTGDGVEAVYVLRTEWLWYSARQSDGVVCPYPCPLSAYLPPDVEAGFVDQEKWSAIQHIDGINFFEDTYVDTKSSENRLNRIWAFEIDDHCSYHLKYAVIFLKNQNYNKPNIPLILSNIISEYK